jgi:putative nucleotidyltransferase with HDIG domain
MEEKPSGQAEEFLRRLAAAIRAAGLYSSHHPLIRRNVDALVTSVGTLLSARPDITVGVIGAEIIVGDVPVGRADAMGGVMRRLEAAGIDRVVIERGVEADELALFVQTLGTASAHREDNSPAAALLGFPHIRVGRIQIDERAETRLTDMATIGRLYADAVSAARTVWDSAATELQPDIGAARAMIDGLAQAIVHNRSALIALTALKEYDNYTFTHMVNVAILTMGQARGLGMDGPLLREFGLAALMHDIGKVKTPIEILNKPDKLDDDEFAIMKRHTIDGAEILRKTPDMAVLAPIVAFEHHLRLDGSGYPPVSRPSLNLCTMFCSIADVFDAMRSQRRYQGAFPTERILAVLKHKDGTLFDRNLVRRFVQLIGIYPVGNLVRLDTGHVAIVLQVAARDPHRPRVRVIFDANGRRLDHSFEVSLWEAGTEPDSGPTSILGPVDPAAFGVDPLSLM